MSRVFKPCDTCDGEGTMEVPVSPVRCDPTSETKLVRCWGCEGERMLPADCEHPNCKREATVDCLLHPAPDGNFDDRYLCGHHHAEWLSGFDDTEADVTRAETNFLENGNQR
jgi:hypothetical protein